MATLNLHTPTVNRSTPRLLTWPTKAKMLSMIVDIYSEV